MAGSPDEPRRNGLRPTAGRLGGGVAWNNVAKSYLIQMPPGSANWGIGNRGEQVLNKMPTFDPGQELPALPQGIKNHRVRQWLRQAFIWSSSESALGHRRLRTSTTRASWVRRGGVACGDLGCRISASESVIYQNRSHIPQCGGVPMQYCHWVGMPASCPPFPSRSCRSEPEAWLPALRVTCSGPVLHFPTQILAQ